MCGLPNSRRICPASCYNICKEQKQRSTFFQLSTGVCYEKHSKILWGGLLAKLILLFCVAFMCATLAVSTVASADESDANLESSTSYVTIYRLYNPYSGEHLYTESKDEYDYLGKIAWRQESVAWNSPSKSNTPVYRLYNRYSGEHHYTTSWKEYSYLGSIGWTQEDVSFWSYDADGTTGTTTYRLFNAYETVGTHHYTTSKKEYDYLSSIGWKPEGVC